MEERRDAVDGDGRLVDASNGLPACEARLKRWVLMVADADDSLSGPLVDWEGRDAAENV